MNDRERFHAIMSYESFDRLPVWFFGTWKETKERWKKEGLSSIEITNGSGGPQLPEMDADWESGKWNIHGLANPNAIGDLAHAVLEETADYRIERDSLGTVRKIGKHGSSIPHTLEYPLKPTWESWERFRSFLDADAAGRRPEGWEAKAAELDKRERVAAFTAGSLFGRLRDWMGVEELSYLPYDDPELFEAILDHEAGFYMSLFEPMLRATHFEFGYFFEDCCFKNGPLISPEIYKRFYDPRYRRMTEFYHDMGVPFLLMDSDGKVDELLPLWLDSGIDIVFPIEVGTWNADPVALRKQYGKRLRMMGGVDKHVIPHGEKAIRSHLMHRRDIAMEGGYIPFPDHRIPPDCSLEQFRTYLRVFREVFEIEEPVPACA